MEQEKKHWQNQRQAICYHPFVFSNWPYEERVTEGQKPPQFPKSQLLSYLDFLSFSILLYLPDPQHLITLHPDYYNSLQISLLTLVFLLPYLHLNLPSVDIYLPKIQSSPVPPSSKTFPVTPLP